MALIASSQGSVIPSKLSKEDMIFFISKVQQLMAKISKRRMSSSREYGVTSTEDVGRNLAMLC